MSPGVFSSEPNQFAYMIENGLYGATWAYPNIESPKVIARELAWGREHRVPRIEVTDDSAEVVRQLSEQVPDQDCLYVVLVDGRTFLIPAEFDGHPTWHTIAAEGQDVIAAGHVTITAAGRVRGWTSMSGHYRPHERQAVEVAQAVFTLAGIRG